MLLRDVEPGDLDLYVRMRCDPVMTAELGGPQPRDGIDGKLAKDVARAATDEHWVLMIVPDPQRPDAVAGSISLWTEKDTDHSEIGWMVFPEFQGQGIGKRATGMVLDRARADGRWGPIHAYPAVTNAPSNGICRTLGFTLLGPLDLEYNHQILHSNDWVIEL